MPGGYGLEPMKTQWRFYRGHAFDVHPSAKNSVSIPLLTEGTTHFMVFIEA